MLDRIDREQLILQIALNTKITEEALLKMDDKRIIDLYKVKVLKEEQ
ncbi:hypothetical protein J14TS2_44810 [Bacillus sp. J14TS2]|nr:hypothetical protein [Bacillus sp. J14TS2]GIN74006.1 hypothetical protein J14TS2_44810 [Bacillus sp. J14TS2]